MPDGPMVMDSPFTTSVVVAMPAPYVIVEPPRTTIELPMAENGSPSRITVFDAVLTGAAVVGFATTTSATAAVIGTSIETAGPMI